MAMEVVVQRLQMGDVILVNLGEQSDVEAQVVRPPGRTAATVQAMLRVDEVGDFVQEWPLGALVTVVRGP